jgi:hypothetical protein
MNILVTRLRWAKSGAVSLYSPMPSKVQDFLRRKYE